MGRRSVRFVTAGGARLGACLLGIAVSAAAAQNCPSVDDLGTLGGLYSKANAVSADGSVVVGYAYTSTSALRAFRWTASGGMQDLGTLGGLSSEAYGVSADGSVVVGRSYPSFGSQHAFLWTAEEGMQDIGVLPGGTISFANGVSADGLVVVGNASNVSGNYRAFRWTEEGGMQDLGTLGGPSSGAYGVSADGSVVVGQASTPAGVYHAFRWSIEGGMQDLGTLNGVLSFARAVSADGSVVVGDARNGSEDHAFRWTSLGGMKDLGTLGGTTSTAYGVSADGTVVVGRSYPASSSVHRAFRWTRGGLMQDLSDVGGGRPSEVYATSADGSVVVGGGSPTRALRWSVGDLDDDGLLDCWEINGIDVNDDGLIDFDLPAMGARVDRKDVFVEVDAMVGRKATMADLQGVVDAFDQAPVPPPPGGGEGGIALYLIMDETDIPLAPFPNPAVGLAAVKAARFGTVAERTSPNWAHIKAAKSKAVHYCIFADTHSNGFRSGYGEHPGNDFIVTLGAWSPVGGTADDRAGTFMHELGHNLGLGHGGGDWEGFKPNYYSVMNYRWQVPHSGYPDLWRLDYSREQLPPLDEHMLNEAVSLGATRPEYANIRVPFTTGADTWGWAPLAGGSTVDWNGDGTTPTPGPVVADISRENASDLPGVLNILKGHDDWANLRYALAGDPHFADGYIDTTFNDEFDLDDFAANEQIPPPPPAPCIADVNDDAILDFFDVQRFLNDHASGDPRADFAHDGEFDLFDVEAFLQAFNNGCP